MPRCFLQRNKVCSEPQTGKPWCFLSSPMNTRVFQVRPTSLYHTDLELLVRLLVGIGPDPGRLGRGSRHLLKAVVPRLFRVFAGQINYFEHYNGGNPVSQLQSSDFTKGLFFFSFYLKVKVGQTPGWRTPGCPTINSALHCGYQLC